MAFATPIARATSTEDANVTTHDVALPDGSNVAGRLLVVALSMRSIGTFQLPAGWTAGYADELGPNGTTGPLVAVRWKILTGSEGYGATGAVQQFTSSVSQQSAHRSWLIEAGAFDPAYPLVITRVEGTSTTPDSPVITPTFGAADFHFIALFGCEDDNPTSGYPTNYTTSQLHIAPTGGACTLVVAERAANTATENPSAFTQDSSLAWVAVTIAIRPNRSPLVYGSDDYTVAADADLAAYDPKWAAAYVLGGSSILVQASTDDLRNPSATDVAVYRWTGVTLLEQKIVGDLRAGLNRWPGLTARNPAASANQGYMAEWDAELGDIVLYRVTAGPTYTIIAQGGAVTSTETVFTNCYVRATGTNPVNVTAGDDTNGATLTYDDTNAARHQSGQPAVSLYNATASIAGATNVKIYDEGAAPPPPAVPVRKRRRRLTPSRSPGQCAK